MTEPTKSFAFGNDAMTQYTAQGNELRFYADQRFKIATAFLVANGLLANVAKDYKSMTLALIGMVLSYLCLSWDVRTALWWGRLLEALKRIEGEGHSSGNLVKAYLCYDKPSKCKVYRAFVKPSYAIGGIYVASFLAWLLFFFRSWPQWWKHL